METEKPQPVSITKALDIAPLIGEGRVISATIPISTQGEADAVASALQQDRILVRLTLNVMPPPNKPFSLYSVLEALAGNKTLNELNVRIPGSPPDIDPTRPYRDRMATHTKIVHAWMQTAFAQSVNLVHAHDMWNGKEIAKPFGNGEQAAQLASKIIKDGAFGLSRKDICDIEERQSAVLTALWAKMKNRMQVLEALEIVNTASRELLARPFKSIRAIAPDNGGEEGFWRVLPVSARTEHTPETIAEAAPFRPGNASAPHISGSPGRFREPD